ncbi:hypothetical protein IW262DRAFT_1295501 [Armillaria fumosa]|nr:hypothetical protein IW262DRAFT_1295501 [Armillaria fumosa]
MYSWYVICRDTREIWNLAHTVDEVDGILGEIKDSISNAGKSADMPYKQANEENREKAMSITMTTRSKKWGTLPTTINKDATCASSPLTPTETLQVEWETVPSPANSSGLPGAFNSTEDRRRRVLEKSKVTPMDRDWRTGNNPVDNITALSNTVETKPTSDESKLIPVLEEDNVDDELGIAEFKSNRALSPENDAMLVEQSNEHQTSDVTNRINEPDHARTTNDDNQDNHSSDTDDQLAYELAHDSNGPWTDPVEDERSAQLYLDKLSDHQRAVTQVLAHRQVGLIFSRFGFREVDPELDMYQEQYNIVVTTMVGGRLAMGRNNSLDDDQGRNDMNPIDWQTAMDEQLHDIAAQDKAVRFPIETSNVTSPIEIKEEEHTPSLSTSDIRIHDVGTTDETTPVAKGAPNEEESQDEQTQNVQTSTAPRYGWTIKDRVILQRWRIHDLADTGQTEIADQGIHIDDDGKAYIVKGGIVDTKGWNKSPLNNRMLKPMLTKGLP